MSLVCKQLTINESTTFDCWIFVIRNANGVDEFWFKECDIAEFLGYAKPTNAIADNVFIEWCSSWETLSPAGGSIMSSIHDGASSDEESSDNDLTHSLDPKTIFISEAGVYALVLHSKKHEALEFQKWLMNDALPALRRDLIQEYMDSFRDAGELKHLNLEGLRGYVYLATTPSYRQNKIYTIGYTSNLEQRLNNLNAVRTNDDEFEYVGCWPTDDCPVT